MATFKGKSGTVYDVQINLGVARRLVREFGLDILSQRKEAGLAFAAELALNICLLNVPPKLRTEKSIEFDRDFTDPDALQAMAAAVLGELADFFQRLGLTAEPPPEKTGNGSTATNLPRSPMLSTTAPSL